MKRFMNNCIDRKIDGWLDVLRETDIKALNCSVQSPLRIKRISWLTGDSEHTIYIHSYLLICILTTCSTIIRGLVNPKVACL